jgi:hypothetical protein
MGVSIVRDLRYLSGGVDISKVMPQNLNPIVQRELFCHLDARNPNSYPGSGTSWFDLSGNGNHATLVGSPPHSYTDGFTWGSGRYATLPNNVLNVASEGFTIEAWVRYSSTPITNNPIFYSDGSSTGTHAYLNITNTPSLIVGVGSSTYTFNNSAMTLSANTWHHVVGTRERGVGGSTQYYYIRTMLNAVPPIAVATNVSTSITNASSRIAGNSSTGDYFTGQIAVIRLYRTGLKSGEVYYNYRAERNSFGRTV